MYVYDRYIRLIYSNKRSALLRYTVIVCKVAYTVRCAYIMCEDTRTDITDIGDINTHTLIYSLYHISA